VPAEHAQTRNLDDGSVVFVNEDDFVKRLAVERGPQFLQHREQRRGLIACHPLPLRWIESNPQSTGHRQEESAKGDDSDDAQLDGESVGCRNHQGDAGQDQGQRAEQQEPKVAIGQQHQSHHTADIAFRVAGGNLLQSLDYQVELVPSHAGILAGTRRKSTGVSATDRTGFYAPPSAIVRLWPMAAKNF
jgi:hypothetical protein